MRRTVTLALMVLFGASGMAAPLPLSSLHLGAHLHALAVFDSGEVIVFATHGSTAISRNGGRTFTPVRALAGMDGMEVAGAKAGRIIAVAGHNGFMISRDGGVTWKSLSAHLPGDDTHVLGIDASNPNRMIAYVVGHGIFESHDAGATWAKRADPPQTPMGTALIRGAVVMIPAMVMQPSMGMQGVLRSSDDGKHWAYVEPKIGGMSIVADPKNSRTLYFSGGSGNFSVSFDGGRRWISRPLPAGAEVVAPSGENALYAAGYPRHVGIVWRSTDSGIHWMRLSR